MADRRVVHIKRVSFAGSGASLVFSDEALGIEVFQHAGAGVVHELAFSGLRCRPDYHCRFASGEAAQAHRMQWIACQRASFESKQARVAQRRESLRSSGQPLRVGDVLVACWGYDQTSYDYYQVTRVFGSRSVEIRELAQATGATGQAMAGECVPVKGHFVGEPMTKRVDAEGRVKVRAWGVWASKKESVEVGGLEVFKPDHFTAYA